MSGVFADRLNNLFETVHPPGRGPYSAHEVVKGLRAKGIHISAAYLSQLRSGVRVNPSATTMKAIAGYFRIDPRYFTDDTYYTRMSRELSFLSTLRDEGVRAVASRTLGLSEQSQRELLTAADELRVREQLSSHAEPLRHASAAVRAE